MSIIIHYVANPPQYARDRVTNKMNNYNYQVGDRITHCFNTFTNWYPWRTWVCTVAGNSGFNGFSPTSDSATTVAYGESSWALTDSKLGWSTAATFAVNYEGPSNQILNYIDHKYHGIHEQDLNRFVNNVTTNVWVDPDTMRPMNALRYQTIGGGYGNNVETWTHQHFFGHGNGGYYNRPGLLTPSGSDSSNSCVDSRTIVDSSGLYLYDSWGVDVTMNSDTAQITPVTGAGITIKKGPGVTTYTNLVSAAFATYSEADATSAQTISVSTASSHLASTPGATRYWQRGTSTPWKAAHAGHLCSFVETYNCWRNAFQSWETPHSLQLAWSTSLPPDAAWMVVSPSITVCNDLTGARTVTVRFMTDCPHEITNNDIWVDVFYNSSATTQAYVNATSMDANYGAPWAQGTPYTKESNSTWTVSTGVFYPQVIAMTVPITIARASPLIVRVVCASIKFNGSIVYVDPNVEVT